MGKKVVGDITLKLSEEEIYIDEEFGRENLFDPVNTIKPSITRRAMLGRI